MIFHKKTPGHNPHGALEKRLGSRLHEKWLPPTVVIVKSVTRAIQKNEGLNFGYKDLGVTISPSNRMCSK